MIFRFSASVAKRAVTSASVPDQSSMSHGSVGRAHLRRGQAQVARQQRSPSARITARSIAFCSSRTLPGHECSTSIASASGDSVSFLPTSRRDALDEVMRQLRDVLLALAQRRNRDREHRQAEIQVLAELPRRHRLPQHAVGGGDNADVDLDRSVAAEPLDALGLDGAQHLGLQRQRHLADLVEEDGAALRHLELADLALRRAGEGAALVAEQLRLEQVLGNRGAVDGHERPVGARAARCAAPARTAPCRCRSRLRAAPWCRCRRRARSRSSPAATPASRR